MTKQLQGLQAAAAYLADIKAFHDHHGSNVPGDMKQRVRDLLAQVNAGIDEALSTERQRIQAVVDMLNDALEKDPATINELLRKHAECNDDLADYTPIVAQPVDGRVPGEEVLVVSPLGLINGVLGIWSRNYRVAAMWSGDPILDPAAKVVGFTLHNLNDVVTMPEPAE